MQIVGIERPRGKVEVACLSADGRSLTPLADVYEFWNAPRRCLSRGSSSDSIPLEPALLVPPLRPDAQVLCVGLNYREHVTEGSFQTQPLPEHPTIFARWSRSLSVDGVALPVPTDEDGMDWEGEVVAWVGRTLVDASEAEALEAVIGYSVFNDLTARKAQKRTSQWSLGKNADRSGVLGPMIPASEVGSLDAGLRLQTRVNGELMQDASTRDMIHRVGPTLAHISRTLTLRPGDLLATGTPSGVGYARKPPRLLQPGDMVEVAVERLGTIRTPIVDATHRWAYVHRQ